jgi:plastocyanin
MSPVRRLPALVFVALAASCGSSSDPATPSGPSAPAAPAGPPTISITADGVSPKEVTIPVGGRVIFINNDRIPHDVAGGADLTSHDCVEIDAVGFLTPGRSGQTAPMPEARTCDFHDHGFHSPIFTGKVHIR